MRLDKDEAAAPDYSTITPPFLEISGDVSVVGFEPIDDVDKLVKKMMARYIKSEAKDVEFEEVDNDKTQ